MVKAINGQLIENQPYYIKHDKNPGLMISVTAIPIIENDNVIGAIGIHDEQLGTKEESLSQLNLITNQLRERIKRYSHV